MKNIILIFILMLSCTVILAQTAYKKFFVSNETFQKYKVNYKKLAIGMTKEKVNQLMGKPHIDETLVSKKGDPQGSVMSYYIARNHPDLVNEKHDVVIQIFFNVKEELDYVVPKNIPGFEKIGPRNTTVGNTSSN